MLFGLLRNIGNERYNKDPIRNPERKLIVKWRRAINIARQIPYLKNEKQRKSSGKKIS